MYTLQKAAHWASIAALSAASCVAGSSDPDVSVGFVDGSDEAAVSLDATGELELGEMSTTDGLGAAADPELLALVGSSAVVEVHPATNNAMAAAHAVMRRGAARGGPCRCVVMSGSLGGR